MPWIIPLATAAYSVYNSAHAASKAKKAENQLEDSLNNAPKYKPNSSILQYYDEALRKYNANPSDTREYKMASQGIKQGTVQGLNYLQDRRSGLAGVPTLIANQNNSLLKAAVNSENRKAQEFGVLGNAANMKAGQEAKAFQQNELYPFEAKYNLLSAKAAGNRAAQRQETSNVFNNLGAAASLYDGGDMNWGTGRNQWGQQTRTVAGQSFTKPKYNRINNQWMNNMSNFRGW